MHTHAHKLTVTYNMYNILRKNLGFCATMIVIFESSLVLYIYFGVSCSCTAARAAAAAADDDDDNDDAAARPRCDRFTRRLWWVYYIYY